MVSPGWMAVDCANLTKDGKCKYSGSMFCPLNVSPGIKMGKGCVYAQVHSKTSIK